MKTFRPKKVRGLKRRIKSIERWKKQNIELDIEYLKEYHRDYVKLYIKPFYNLYAKPMPLWYRRLVFKAMIDVYQSWQNQLNTLNEPFYLKLWIFEHDFTQSQIVTAIRSEYDTYDRTFDTNTKQKPFPVHTYNPDFDIPSSISWEYSIFAAKWSLRELKDDLELGLVTEKQMQRIKDTAYKKEDVNVRGRTDTLYHTKEDNVWIGG